MYTLGYIWPFVQRPRPGVGFAAAPDAAPSEKPAITEEDRRVAEERAALIAEGARVGVQEGLALATKFGLVLGLTVAGLALGGSTLAALVTRDTRRGRQESADGVE